MKNHNPNPSESFVPSEANEAGPRRGKLKIFFGYAAGVGKTYAMLDAARSQVVEGMDVVVGCVETLGCAETDRLLNGLQVLTPRTVTDQGKTYNEFDLDAALARNPVLILIDELAHSNMPGSRHTKRWQDVRELLEAGINVYASLNVQHLESLKDLIFRITGIGIQDTIPDSVVEQADELELIDLAPDDLLQRLREGKVCISEDTSHAISHFFRKENLIALRELTLRWVADRVDTQMQDYRRDHPVAHAWSIRERILVGVSQAPDSPQLVRAAHGKGLARRMACGSHRNPRVFAPH
jgi:two-component system, OmpR family, sensor histidine kinase KdpD